MIAPDYEFQRRVAFARTFSGSQTWPKIAVLFGQFAVLVAMAAAVGKAVGFATALFLSS
jgi:hypothetical protein